MQPDTPLPFELKLKAFHERLIQRWHEMHDQLVGVSIQVGESSRQNTDNCTSTTREIGPFVNPFCASVLKLDDQLKKCDMLDLLLKRKASAFHQQFEKTHDRATIGCRCHRGVSNFLTPYVHFADKQQPATKWYVFIGQFVLQAPGTKAEAQSANSEFKKQKFIDLVPEKIAENERQFIQPFPFIKSGNSNETLIRSGISLLSWIDFLRFHSNVLARFDEFLLPFYDDTGKPIRELSDFIGREEREIDGLLLSIGEALRSIHGVALLDGKRPEELMAALEEANTLLKHRDSFVSKDWINWFRDRLNPHLDGLRAQNGYLDRNIIGAFRAEMREAFEALKALPLT